MAAVVVSTIMIVIFGEVIPQAVRLFRRFELTADLRALRSGHRRRVCSYGSRPHGPVRSCRLAHRQAS